VNPVRLLRQQLQALSAAGLSHLPRADALPDAILPSGAPMPSDSLAVPTQVFPACVPVRTPEDRPTGPSASASLKAAMAHNQIESRNVAAPKQPSTHRQGPFLFGSIPDPHSTATHDERQTALAVLADQVKSCTRCSELAATRTQTVFGVGNPQARILFIGEAPGADEDRQGEPFVGKAGQLLNQIIAASRLKREEVYICNILKCRPPGNRTPLEDECGNCREYLLGQLATIDPEYIVCWGAVAAQNLLASTLTIGKLRGRFLQFGRAKVLCTYHPSYLLRNPAAKKDVWQDMQFLMADMGVDLTARS
jgi:DNA polymerase